MKSFLIILGCCFLGAFLGNLLGFTIKLFVSECVSWIDLLRAVIMFVWFALSAYIYDIVEK